jgi:phosphoribosylformylglycinamidine cyclo-ligase
MDSKGLYDKRGVSAQKEEVHAATKNLDKGLFPNAFCKIYPDHLCGDDDWVNVMHADGAGTKSILAYLYWKETGDISVWKGIAQDAIVMNLDDLLCVGIYDQLLFSSTIDRNKQKIPGEVLEAIINGTQEFFDQMKAFGVHIHYMGGETADVGDVVRTIAVNGTMTARWPKSKIITNEKIKAGDVIVGLAGFGQSKYEFAYNSGIASNGLTSARHDALDKSYAGMYPESYDPSLDNDVTYIGPHKLTDHIETNDNRFEIGQLLLSPTRTFAPVMLQLFREHFDSIHGLIHCSGGGQTKCLKYLPANLRIIKDALFEPPVVFPLLQQASGATDNEMYQVFNMGTRMEIYTNEKDARKFINISESLGVPAKIVGRVEASSQKELLVTTPSGTLHYNVK